jgi:hypothetical protein
MDQIEIISQRRKERLKDLGIAKGVGLDGFNHTLDFGAGLDTAESLFVTNVFNFVG